MPVYEIVRTCRKFLRAEIANLKRLSLEESLEALIPSLPSRMVDTLNPIKNTIWLPPEILSGIAQRKQCQRML
jgi:hypothetical protein